MALTMATAPPRILSQAQGPQACSYTKRVSGGTGQSAILNGKTVTLKVNGSNPLIFTNAAPFSLPIRRCDAVAQMKSQAKRRTFDGQRG